MDWILHGVCCSEKVNFQEYALLIQILRKANLLTTISEMVRSMREGRWAPPAGQRGHDIRREKSICEGNNQVAEDREIGKVGLSKYDMKYESRNIFR